MGWLCKQTGKLVIIKALLVTFRNQININNVKYFRLYLQIKYRMDLSSLESLSNKPTIANRKRRPDSPGFLFTKMLSKEDKMKPIIASDSLSDDEEGIESEDGNGENTDDVTVAPLESDSKIPNQPPVKTHCPNSTDCRENGMNYSD